MRRPARTVYAAGAMNHHTLTDSFMSSSASADAISRRAYEIWEREGRPEGCDLRHWLEAEQELGGDRSSGIGADSISGDNPQPDSPGNFDRAPLQGTRTGAATKPSREKRSSRSPFGNEKNGGGNSGAQTGGRRKNSRTPGL